MQRFWAFRANLKLVAQPHVGMAVVAPEGAGDAGVVQNDTATLAPHRSVVYLDQARSGEYVLTHTRSLERKVLPLRRTWALDFDSEGFAFAHDCDDESDGSILWAEDLFDFVLYTASSGEEVIVSSSSTSDEGAGMQNVFMREFRAKYVESEAYMTFGPFKKMHAVALCIAKCPRMGSRIFLSLKDLYSLMALDQFNGDSWRWISGSKMRWAAAFQKLGLEGHFQSSSACKRGSRSSAQPADDEGPMCPFNGVSPHGLFWLASRWADFGERRCGFRAPEHRLVAGFLMDYLVSLVAAQDTTIDIDMCATWEHRWPKPPLMRCCLELKVLAGGGLDTSGWGDCVSFHGPQSFAAKALPAMRAAMGMSPSLRGLMLARGEDARLHSLEKQLVCWCGQLLHTRLLQALKGVKSATLTAKSVHVEDVFGSKRRMDARIVRYMSTCKALVKECRFLALCTDKAAVGGFNLQATTMTLPDNSALVPPPQAMLAGNRGVGWPNFFCRNRRFSQRKVPVGESYHVTSFWLFFRVLTSHNTFPGGFFHRGFFLWKNGFPTHDFSLCFFLSGIANCFCFSSRNFGRENRRFGALLGRAGLLAGDEGLRLPGRLRREVAAEGHRAGGHLQAAQGMDETDGSLCWVYDMAAGEETQNRRAEVHHER